MNFLEVLSAQPGVPRLGSTLLHFLWQGAAISVVYAAARRRLGECVPNVRYLVACAALASMAAAPLVTWWVLGPGPAAVATVAPAAPFAGGAFGIVRSVPVSLPAGVTGAAAAPFLPWVVAVWLVGATALWVRLMGGWMLAARLGTRLVRPAPAAWQQTLERLKARMRVSAPVRLLQSSRVQAPAVVGWLRPVVLAPIGALAGLPADEMEALLLHELAHIRRHDYLVNMLQSAVEALLFYHPAVWWVSGHMRAERELCCDDAAVSVGGDAVLYARALAGLGSLCPPVVMAANGGHLSHRIGRLLGQSRTAPRRLSGAGVAVAALLPIVAAVAVFGQPAARPKFEVVSIKPAGEDGPRMMRPLPNGLTGTVSFRQLMEIAYAAQPFQIAGGAGWINSERYTIDAKAAGAASHQQIFLMLQSLLEERFQLKTHREMRDMPIFSLVIAKGGPKLPAAKAGSCAESEPQPEPDGGRMAPPGRGVEPLPRCGGLDVMLQDGGARMFGGRTAMPELVRTLSRVLGRTVVDQTGFTGTFDTDLTFLPDETTPSLPPPPPDAATGGAISPPILTALPQQLGLRLDAAKGPVEVIVIDRVERPTAN